MFLKDGRFDSVLYVHGKRERLGGVQTPDNIKCMSFKIFEFVLF